MSSAARGRRSGRSSEPTQRSARAFNGTPRQSNAGLRTRLVMLGMAVLMLAPYKTIRDLVLRKMPVAA